MADFRATPGRVSEIFTNEFFVKIEIIKRRSESTRRVGRSLLSNIFTIEDFRWATAVSFYRLKKTLCNNKILVYQE
jgi:hypothetical protein